MKISSIKDCNYGKTFKKLGDKPINKPVVVFRNGGSPQPINNKGNKLDKFL